MKLLYTLFASALVGTIQAQCPFTPTIEPDPALVCPGTFLYLNTQVYDSYQWYENGMAITGANFQGIQVDQNSILHEFTVACTQDGCTETSAPVLLDGWVFLLPYAITAGDPPLFTGFEGEAYYCPEDTVLLIMGMPYDTNIQWTENGTPIPDATNDTLIVTGSGLYSVSGTPGVCPGFVQELGVTIPIHFLNYAIPAIVEVGDQLCIYPNMTTYYQWYLNGAPIVTGGECFTPTLTGEYTVSASYADQCGPVTSEPYDFFLGLGDLGANTQVLVRPNPANETITVASSSALQSPWCLLDPAGREVLNGRFAGCTACTIALDAVEAGEYILAYTAPFGQRAIRLTVLR